MQTVTISPKFQVVIPKSVREELNLVPGQKVHVLSFGSHIEFIPVRPARELRGFLKGREIGFERDETDRL
jgi:AbrB family looped-hinge helix DNA binding protein